MTRRVSTTLGRRAVGAAALALTALIAVPGVGQVPTPVDGTAVLGHLAVADVANAGAWTWSLGTDGLVIAWRDGRASAWAHVDGATRLAIDAGRVVAVTPTSLVRFAPPLVGREEAAFDGTSACRGASGAWAWTGDPVRLVFVGPDGQRDVPATTVPAADARCTVADVEAALAWDDGFGAVGVTTSGLPLEGVWYGDARPRAVREGGTWRLARPDEVGADQACDLQSDGPRCAAPDPSIAGALRAPELREPIGAALHDGGLVIADRGGWTAVQPDVRSPDVRRFDAPVVAFVEGDHAVVVICDATPAPRVAIVDPMHGTELASASVDECPRGARRVAGRLTIETPTVTLVHDPESGRFVDAAPTTLRGGAFAAVAEWSAACAGVATAVVDTTSGRRVYGPSCAPVRVVDVRDGEGRRAGAAVCGVGEHPLALLRLDGGALADADGTCAAGEFRVDSAELHPPPIVAPVIVRVDGSRVHLASASRSAIVLATGDGIVAHGEDWLWASEGLWDRVAWWSGDVGHTLADPETERVWRPSGLAEVLSGEP